MFKIYISELSNVISMGVLKTAVVTKIVEEKVKLHRIFLSEVLNTVLSFGCRCWINYQAAHSQFRFAMPNACILDP